MLTILSYSINIRVLITGSGRYRENIIICLAIIFVAFVGQQCCQFLCQRVTSSDLLPVKDGHRPHSSKYCLGNFILSSYKFLGTLKDMYQTGVLDPTVMYRLMEIISLWRVVSLGQSLYDQNKARKCQKLPSLTQTISNVLILDHNFVHCAFEKYICCMFSF